jgi:hypothetical protein
MRGELLTYACSDATSPKDCYPMATEHEHQHDREHGHGHGDDSSLARVEALKNEGAHRAGEHEGPFSLHVLGLGATGAGAISALMNGDQT